MGNNFYQTNNEILKLDPYNKKDLEYIQFNNYICRKENLQRCKNELDRGLFKLSYTTIIEDTGLSRKKVQTIMKWFEEKGIIECIKKSTKKGLYSVYAYTSVYYSEEEIGEKKDTDLDTDLDTNLSSISNGLKVIKDTNLDTDLDTSKKENEKEKVKSNICSISDSAFTKIFNLWNSKNIIKHKKATDNMVRAYKKALKTYTDNEIVEAIENYNKCLKDDNFYYTHRFTLEKFLKQANGISNFVNDGEVYINYLNQANTKPVQDTNGIDEKYKDTFTYKGYEVKAKFYPRKHLSYYNCDNEYIESDNGIYEIPYSEIKRVNILNKKAPTGAGTQNKNNNVNSSICTSRRRYTQACDIG